MSKLKAAQHLRVAERAEYVILYDLLKGKCVKLDKISYSIFIYIKEKQPGEKEIAAAFQEHAVSEDEVQKFIDWLRKMGFVKETDDEKAS